MDEVFCDKLIYQPFPEMIKGGMLADAVAIIGGLNVVAGELDR